MFLSKVGDAGLALNRGIDALAGAPALPRGKTAGKHIKHY
jgi:hypothetical protein